MRTSWILLGGLGLSACGTTEPTSTPGESLALVGQIAGVLDPASGALRFEVASTSRGFQPLNNVQDGTPGAGPVGSTELVTLPGTVGFDCAGGGINSWGGDVLLNSFYPVALSDLVVRISSVTPATGFDPSPLTNDPPFMGLDNTNGLFRYTGGPGTAETWCFDIAGAGPWHFTGLVYGTPAAAAPASCAAILAANPLAGSGTYAIDVDGPGGIAPLNAFCDMTSEGGGWTMILNTEPIGGIDTTTAGEVTDGAHRHMPLATMQALANASSQVYMRSADNVAEFVVSNANNGVITNLRSGLLLNQGLPGGSMATFFTGSQATSALLNYSCATSGAWPNVYWACGNAGGVHVIGAHSRWTWQGGNTAANIGMQLFVR